MPYKKLTQNRSCKTIKLLGKTGEHLYGFESGKKFSYMTSTRGLMDKEKLHKLNFTKFKIFCSTKGTI